MPFDELTLMAKKAGGVQSQGFRYGPAPMAWDPKGCCFHGGSVCSIEYIPNANDVALVTAIEENGRKC